jgi:hypothetical protein
MLMRAEGWFVSLSNFQAAAAEATFEHNAISIRAAAAQVRLLILRFSIGIPFSLLIELAKSAFLIAEEAAAC